MSTSITIDEIKQQVKQRKLQRNNSNENDRIQSTTAHQHEGQQQQQHENTEDTVTHQQQRQSTIHTSYNHRPMNTADIADSNETTTHNQTTINTDTTKTSTIIHHSIIQQMSDATPSIKRHLPQAIKQRIAQQQQGETNKMD